MKIVHSSIDENGRATGGNAGDQTGKEVCTRSWYDKDWKYMLRYPDRNIAISASEIGIKLANSPLVGYDQNQRNTLYKELKKNDFDVDKYIKSGVKTECDCSSFVYACYCCLLPYMRSDETAPRTGNMKDKYSAWGFGVFTDSKYLTEGEYLIKGDILVRPNGHTVMAIENGKKADITPTPIYDYCDVMLPILKKGVTGNAVLSIQMLLEMNGFDVGEYGIDGEFGKDTEKAVKKFQKHINIPINGVVSSETWANLIGTCNGGK